MQSREGSVEQGIGNTAMLLTNNNACLGTIRRQTSPTGGVLHQTTPMTYAMQTKTSRRKSMSPKQFGLPQTHPAKAPMERAVQNLSSKIGLSATFGED